MEKHHRAGSIPAALTLSTTKLMKPEQQQIAIAEACPRLFNSSGEWYQVHGEWFRCRDGSCLNDLNAMHEAENWLRTQGVIWVDYENRITKCDTAAQRAEAFLRTLNLYTPT